MLRHSLRSNLHEDVQLRVPLLYPSDMQVSPLRSVVSHSSLDWLTTPSPQIGHELKAVQVELQFNGQAPLPAGSSQISVPSRIPLLQICITGHPSAGISSQTPLQLLEIHAGGGVKSSKAAQTGVRLLA